MAIIESDVVSWYDMDEGSGATLNDKKSTNDGTIANATWTTGGPTNLPDGLDFNGVNATVDFNFDPALDTGTAIVWVESDAVASTQVIFGHGNLGGRFDIFTESSSMKGRVRYTGDVTAAFAAANSTLYFVAFTWSSSSATGVELYKDGTSQDTATGTGSPNTMARDLYMGSNQGANSWFNGRVYQAAVFNRILTSTEISTLYNSGAGQTYQQTIAKIISVVDTMNIGDIATTIRVAIIQAIDTLHIGDIATIIRIGIIQVVDTLNIGDFITQFQKFWTRLTKSSTSWTNSNKSSTSFTNQNKSSTNWTNQDKS